MNAFNVSDLQKARNKIIEAGEKIEGDIMPMLDGDMLYGRGPD